MSNLNVILTCAGGYGALTLLEDFQRSKIGKNVNFIGTHSDKILLGRSPLKSNYIVPSALKNPKEYLQATKKIIEVENIDLVIPKSDAEVKALYPVINDLNCQTFLPDCKEIEATQDKLDFYKILENHSVPAPKTLQVDSIDTLQYLFDQIEEVDGRYWLRIKTAGTAGAYGATWVTNKEEAIVWIESFCKKEGTSIEDFTLSEYLPGRLFECMVLYNEGNLKLAKVYENLMFASGGDPQNRGIGSTPNLAKTINDEVSRLAVENAVHAIDAASKECETIPNGVYHMSAKQNSKGEPCITEVNIGRTPSTVSIFNRTGKYNVAEYFLNYALKQEITDPDPIYDIPTETFFAIRSLDHPLCIRSEEELNLAIEI